MQVMVLNDGTGASTMMFYSLIRPIIYNVNDTGA